MMKNKILLVIAAIIVLGGAAFFLTRNNTGTGLDEAARQQYLADIKSAEDRIAKNPNDPNAYLAKGVAEYNLGRFDSAEKSYQKVIELDGANYIAWNNLGNVYRDSKEYQKAEEAYRKALAINTQAVLPYTNLSKLYSIWSSKKDQTAVVLEEGLRAIPGNQILLQELVDYYDKAGDQAKADSFRAQLAGQER